MPFTLEGLLSKQTHPSGRNTFGTCFGETGLKRRPDVFCHDNCEQFFEKLCTYVLFFHFLTKKKREAKLIYGLY
jgi:hypothetical protein